MSQSNRRRTTWGLFLGAGVLVAIALYLALQAAPEPPPEEVARPTVTAPDPAPDPAPKPAVAVSRPAVDVVFVLDTTGSMEGLIEGAKRKIWSIANQIISGQPRPEVRIGLIGYRDHGDAYVTRRFALSEDIDEVYANLKGFSAAGGGDTPEHVNRALAEAIGKMRWRQGKKVLKLVFLVGDAPPHEGRDGLYSRRLAREAQTRGIVVNAVRCGSMASTAASWRRIAALSGGIYASIRQDGGMVAMRSPMDKRLAALNAELTRTLIAGGSASRRRATRRRAKINAAMGIRAQAESAAFRALSGKIDSGDLLTQIKRGKKLARFKRHELPKAIARLSLAGRKAHVAKVAKRRAKLRAEIKRLHAARRAYLARKTAGRKKGKAFDDQVKKALKAQGGRVGLSYK